MTGLRALVEAVREARDAMSSPEDDAYGASLKRRLREKRLREAEAAAVDAITPDVLAAVDAVVALGAARAAKRTAQKATSAAWGAHYDARRDNHSSDDVDTRCVEWLRTADANQRTHDAWAQANSTLCALADRLAAREGE